MLWSFRLSVLLLLMIPVKAVPADPSGSTPLILKDQCK
jgi:hypothetical protein